LMLEGALRQRGAQPGYASWATSQQYDPSRYSAWQTTPEAQAGNSYLRYAAQQLGF